MPNYYDYPDKMYHMADVLEGELDDEVFEQLIGDLRISAGKFLDDLDKLTSGVNPILISKTTVLQFSSRIKNCLAKMEIDYVVELVLHSQARMLKSRNIGRKSVEEVSRELALHGLSLGMSKNDPMIHRALLLIRYRLNIEEIISSIERKLIEWNGFR